jgi:hypothetical protein
VVGVVELRRAEIINWELTSVVVEDPSGSCQIVAPTFPRVLVTSKPLFGLTAVDLIDGLRVGLLEVLDGCLGLVLRLLLLLLETVVGTTRVNPNPWVPISLLTRLNISSNWNAFLSEVPVAVPMDPEHCGREQSEHYAGCRCHFELSPHHFQSATEFVSKLKKL